MEDKILKAFMRGMIFIGQEHPKILSDFIEEINAEFETNDLMCRYFFNGERLYLSRIVTWIQ